MSLSLLYNYVMNNALITIIAINTKDTRTHRWYLYLDGKNNLSFADFTYNKKLLDILHKKPDSILKGNSIDSSNVFSWLPTYMDSQIMIHIRGKISVQNSELLIYLTYIGTLLCAVETQDSLLVAEIFHKYAKIYMFYKELTLRILEPVSVEGLFAWVWGCFCDYAYNDLVKMMQKKNDKPCEKWDVTEAFFAASKARLNPLALDLRRTTPEKMMVEFFKKNRNTKITLELVGEQFYSWAEKNMDFLDSKMKKLELKDLICGTDFAKKAKNAVFCKTKVCAKAEPDNTYDKNAIGVYLDDLVAKYSGKRNIQLAGYIRRTGAMLIRNARPDLVSFESHLARIGNSNGKNQVVIQIVI